MIVTMLAAILAAPAVVMALALARQPRWSEYANLAASGCSLAGAVGLVIAASRPAWTGLHGYLIVDRLGAWVLLCVAAVYAVSSVYAVGYMRLMGRPARLPGFYALFAGFALSMFLACLMNNAGLYWIAIELTTLVSTFLVGFEPGAESTEAAWKYLIIVSAGISLALLGTVLYYWAGTFVLGPRYRPTWALLTSAAPRMDPRLLLLAFLLVLVGYGAKAGLAPMHTWLPDAHSEAPAPVSAMLSGALLNTALLGIVRFLGVMQGTADAAVARGALIVFGIFSFLVAALFITRQRGVKRLMAYSSVEHIGIMALGFGFGGLWGVVGALYHMLNHALNKSLMFFGAGSTMRAYGGHDMRRIARVLDHFPVSGALWLAGAVAICGAPPFGLFLSEFTIFRAGLAARQGWAVGIALVLLIVVFAAFLGHFRRMYFGRSGASYSPQPNGAWRSGAMWLAFLPVVLLGLWWPAPLWADFAQIARSLRLTP
jgi:hydrogenase-4 component F